MSGDDADPIIDILIQPEEIPAAVGTIDAAEEDQEEPEIEDVDQKAGGSDDILEEGSEDGEDKEDEAKEDDKDGFRPGSVEVKLYVGDTLVEDVDPLTLNESGKKIEYTVSEDKVIEYTAAISGSADKGFTIKNSHTPKKDPGKPDDPKPGPKTGDRSDLFLLILVLAESFVLF